MQQGRRRVVLVNNGAVVEWLRRVSAFFSYWPCKGIFSGFQSPANPFYVSLGVFLEQLFDSRNTMQQVYISNYTFS